MSPVAPAATAEPLPAGGEGVLDSSRQRIKAYYEQSLEKEFARLRALRLSTRLRKLALAGFGCLLLIGSAAAWIASRYRYISWRQLEAYEIALAAIAIVLIVVALFMSSVQDPPDAEAVEREVDGAREQDLHDLLERGRRLLAAGQQPVPTFAIRLVGYPDKELCEKLGAA